MIEGYYKDFDAVIQDLIDGVVDEATQNFTNSENFNNAALRNLKDQFGSFWLSLLKRLKGDNGENEHKGLITKGDFPQNFESLFSYIAKNADLDDNELRNLVAIVKEKILKKKREDQAAADGDDGAGDSDGDSDGTVSDDSTDGHWNESYQKLVEYFIENFNSSFGGPDEDDIEYDHLKQVKQTNGKISNGTENFQFRLTDLINADAGASFNEKPWVTPWVNIDGKTYEEIRGFDTLNQKLTDPIRSVLRAANYLQYTRYPYSDEATSMSDKYSNIIYHSDHVDQYYSLDANKLDSYVNLTEEKINSDDTLTDIEKELTLSAKSIRMSVSAFIDTLRSYKSSVELGMYGDNRDGFLRYLDDEGKSLNYTILNKYIRLLMPEYKRRVEVEDLDRNFWVIAQVISSIGCWLFDPDSPIFNFLRKLLDEIAQLWENLMYLWIGFALVSKKEECEDIKTLFIPVNNSDLTPYIKFDDFNKLTAGDSTDMTIEEQSQLLRACWSLLEYNKEQYTNCHLVILPEIRGNNYFKNYYCKVSYPGVIVYDRNQNKVFYYLFTDQNTNVTTEEFYYWPDLNEDGIVDSEDASITLGIYATEATAGVLDENADTQKQILAGSFGVENVEDMEVDPTEASAILAFVNEDIRNTTILDLIYSQQLSDIGDLIMKPLEDRKGYKLTWESTRKDWHLYTYSFEVSEDEYSDWGISLKGKKHVITNRTQHYYIDLTQTDEPVRTTSWGVRQLKDQYVINPNWTTSKIQESNDAITTEVPEGMYSCLIRTIPTLEAEYKDKQVKIKNLKLDFVDVIRELKNKSSSDSDDKNLLEVWKTTGDSENCQLISDTDDEYCLHIQTDVAKQKPKSTDTLKPSESTVPKSIEMIKVEKGYYQGELLSLSNHVEKYSPPIKFDTDFEIITYWNPDNDVFKQLSIANIADALTTIRNGGTDDLGIKNNWETELENIRNSLPSNTIKACLYKIRIPYNKGDPASSYEAFVKFAYVYNRPGTDIVEDQQYDIIVDSSRTKEQGKDRTDWYDFPYVSAIMYDNAQGWNSRRLQGQIVARTQKQNPFSYNLVYANNNPKIIDTYFTVSIGSGVADQNSSFSSFRTSGFQGPEETKGVYKVKPFYLIVVDRLYYWCEDNYKNIEEQGKSKEEAKEIAKKNFSYKIAYYYKCSQDTRTNPETGHKENYIKATLYKNDIQSQKPPLDDNAFYNHPMVISQKHIQSNFQKLFPVK